MEREPVVFLAPPRPSTAHRVFFNDRGLRAGWRLLVFAAIARVAVWLLGGMLGLLLDLVEGANFRISATSPFGIGLNEMVVFLAVALATWIMARIEQRPAGTYGLPLQRSALSRFLTGYALWGFLPLTLTLGIMRALGVFYFGKPALSVREALPWALAWALVFLLVGLFEEYSFRGYALYTLSDGIGFWPAAIILALVFGSVHMTNGGESYIGILGTILFALVASTMLRRTGALWLAVGAHAGWDWGQSFFYGVSDSGLRAAGHFFDPPAPQGPVWLSGGTVGPEGSIVVLSVLALMAIAVVLCYKPDDEIHALAAQRTTSSGIE